MDKEILEILKRLENKIDEHTRILNQHTQVLNEHTQILRALEHSAEVNKAEHDKLSNDIAKIQGDVTGIKKDLSQVEMVTANNWADIAKLKAVK